VEVFGDERSIGEKGSPYDNTLLKAMFKTIKTEFVNAPISLANKYLTLKFLIMFIGLTIFVFMDH